MTREEAIGMLKAKLECMTRDVSGCDDDCNRRLCGECHLNYEKGTMGEQKEYLRMSIKALEQEPCEDCVSREEVHNLIIPWLNDYLLDETREALETIDYKIEDLPSVTPQTNTGRWVFDEILDKHYYCSECKSMGVNYWDYCPYCGAKMQEVEE